MLKTLPAKDIPESLAKYIGRDEGVLHVSGVHWMVLVYALVGLAIHVSVWIASRKGITGMGVPGFGLLLVSVIPFYSPLKFMFKQVAGFIFLLCAITAPFGPIASLVVVALLALAMWTTCYAVTTRRIIELQTLALLFRLSAAAVTGAAWWYTAASRRAMAQRTEVCWREYRKATAGVGLIIDPPAIVKVLDQVDPEGSDPRLVSLVAESRRLWRDVEQQTGGSTWKLSAQAFLVGFAGGYLDLSSDDEQGLARALGLENLDRLKSLERRAEDLRQAFIREYGPLGFTFE